MQSVVFLAVLFLVASFLVVFGVVFPVEASSPFSRGDSAFRGMVSLKTSVKCRVSESSPVLALPRRGGETAGARFARLRRV